MKLYFSKGACSLSVRIIAHELGIKLNYESVDLHDKKTASGGDYRLITPKGNVPALVLDNGEVLTENIAIHEYLADNHPSPLLPPLGDFQRYRVLEWLSFMASDMHKAFSPLFNPKVPADINASIFVPIMKTRLQTLEKALEDRTYLMGDTFTLPDAYCFVMLRWLPGLNIMLTDFPRVQHFFNTVMGRPAVQAALDEERH